jgi:hypothetical protein
MISPSSRSQSLSSMNSSNGYLIQLQTWGLIKLSTTMARRHWILLLTQTILVIIPCHTRFWRIIMIRTITTHPIAVPDSAWWPGGRMMAAPWCASPLTRDTVIQWSNQYNSVGSMNQYRSMGGFTRDTVIQWSNQYKSVGGIWGMNQYKSVGGMNQYRIMGVSPVTLRFNQWKEYGQERNDIKRLHYKKIHKDQHCGQY